MPLRLFGVDHIVEGLFNSPRIDHMMGSLNKFHMRITNFEMQNEQNTGTGTEQMVRYINELEHVLSHTEEKTSCNDLH